MIKNPILINLILGWYLGFMVWFFIGMTTSIVKTIKTLKPNAAMTPIYLFFRSLIWPYYIYKWCIKKFK